MGATDPAYVTEQTLWNAAGVTGGIPTTYTTYSTITGPNGTNGIVSSVNGNTTWSAEIAAASAAGGGKIINVNNGTYIFTTFDMSSNVLIRGEDINNTILTSSHRFSNASESTDREGLIEFISCTYSGIENLTLLYDSPNVSVADVTGTDLFTPDSYQSQYYSNSPNGQTNLNVTTVEFRPGATDCWLKDLKILESGDAPVWLYGDNNTVENIFVNGALMKGVNGNGYFGITGDNNLVIGCTLNNLRHVGIQTDGNRDPRGNVMVFTYIEGDYNLHNRDAGLNLLENSEVRKQAWHAWGPFHTGDDCCHTAPQPDNYFFLNQLYDDDSTLEFSDPGVVYQTTGLFKDGAEEGIAATALTVPTTGTFYTERTLATVGFVEPNNNPPVGGTLIDSPNSIINLF